MRLFWLIQISPKSNDKCPYRRYAELRALRAQAETGVRQPQATDRLEAPEAGQATEAPLRSLWTGHCCRCVFRLVALQICE